MSYSQQQLNPIIILRNIPSYLGNLNEQRSIILKGREQKMHIFYFLNFFYKKRKVILYIGKNKK